MKCERCGKGVRRANAIVYPIIEVRLGLHPPLEILCKKCLDKDNKELNDPKAPWHINEGW